MYASQFLCQLIGLTCQFRSFGRRRLHCGSAFLRRLCGILQFLLSGGKTPATPTQAAALSESRSVAVQPVATAQPVAQQQAAAPKTSDAASPSRELAVAEVRKDIARIKTAQAARAAAAK